MSFVCRLENTERSNLTPKILNGLFNTSAIDKLSINPLTLIPSVAETSKIDQNDKNFGEIDAIPDIFVDFKNWRENVLFETLYNSLYFRCLQNQKMSFLSQNQFLPNPGQKSPKMGLDLVESIKEEPNQSEYSPNHPQNGQSIPEKSNENFGEKETQDRDQQSLDLNANELTLREGTEASVGGCSDIVVNMGSEIFMEVLEHQRKGSLFNHILELEKPQKDGIVMDKREGVSIAVALDEKKKKLKIEENDFLKDFRKHEPPEEPKVGSVKPTKVSELAGNGFEFEKSSKNEKSQNSNFYPKEFKIDSNHLKQELDYFNYLGCQIYVVYLNVFREILKKSKIDIFSIIEQNRVAIKFSVDNLSQTRYKKSWIELQKYKTKYPFVKIIIDVNLEILKNSDCLRLFKAENLIGVEFRGMEWSRREDNGKYRLVNKELLVYMAEFLEMNYMVLVQVEEAEVEYQKFLYLDVLRRNLLSK